jgi:hypothetical protein
MHFLNLRFRRGNWAPSVWGTLEFYWDLDAKSPNHQKSIFSIFLLIEPKSVGGCLQFENLKGELAPQRFGDYLANLAQRATITVQGFEFEALMVVLDPIA